MKKINKLKNAVVGSSLISMLVCGVAGANPLDNVSADSTASVNQSAQVSVQVFDQSTQGMANSLKWTTDSIASASTEMSAVVSKVSEELYVYSVQPVSEGLQIVIGKLGESINNFSIVIKGSVESLEPLSKEVGHSVQLVSEGLGDYSLTFIVAVGGSLHYAGQGQMEKSAVVLLTLPANLMIALFDSQTMQHEVLAKEYFGK